MATKFNMTRDINGYNGFGLSFTDTAFQTTLAVNVAQSLTIPSSSGMGANGISQSSQWLAVFGIDPGTRVWVANNAVATVPGGAFASTSSELNPTARLVKGGDVLSFITPDTTAEVGVTLYSLS